MVCRQNKKAGFTLIELMLGSLAMIILMMIIGLILVQGWKAWNRGKAIVEMQNGASLAHSAITRQVRATSMDNISAGSVLVCMNTNGMIRFQKSGDDLVASGGMELLLIEDSVTGFSASRTNGMVMVSMTLSAGGFQTEKIFSITPRN